ncbi:MAG: hypothetical protein H6R32_276 [Candidatus Aminicenantes bacterium]|nr:hypothetical protein [Candidatus Aminicenantes bacterium]
MKKTTILIFSMFLLLSTATVAQDLASGFTGTAGMPDTGNNTGGGDVPQTAQITASSFLQPGTLAYLVASLVSLGIYAKRKQRKRN